MVGQKHMFDMAHRSRAPTLYLEGQNSDFFSEFVFSHLMHWRKNLEKIMNIGDGHAFQGNFFSALGTLYIPSKKTIKLKRLARVDNWSDDSESWSDCWTQ